MLLFRSEAHLDRWLRDWMLPRGAILSLDQCWRLANAWYTPDRREPDWRRKTVDEIEALLSELDLTGEYWRLRD